jgi:hypothetical protein
MLSRRGTLKQLSALAGTVGLTGCSQYLAPGTNRLDLPPNPHADRLPARQHATEDYLRVDANGNRLAPEYHLVLLLDLVEEPSVEAAKTVERAMRTIEAAYEWRPEGLFHQLAWGTGYFERIGKLGAAPISRPQVLSRTDDPELQSFDAALVLSTDVPSHLTAVANAMFRRRGELGGAAVEDRLGDVFAVASRRSGFIGEGLPRQHMGVEGIPEDAPIPENAPMFTGFFSGRERTQASEDRVTIQDGQFAEGTTMHLSNLALSLDRWWTGLDDADRVARMFSPEFDPSDVPDFATDVPFSDRVKEHAQAFDVVGHHEKVAQVREDGKPIVLRRDFNTVDGGRAGLHFVSFQRRLADFRKTRKAMNGWYVRDDSPAITDRKNNGLLNFITVRSRANFYVPPRDGRSFPLFV